MKVKLDTKGCQCQLYSFDKDLPREYRGGLFPFFNKKEGVCTVCDYTIFAQKGPKLYVVLLELKKSRQSTLPQLTAGKVFAEFIINTVNRTNKKKTKIKPHIRLVSIIEENIPKKGTKEKGVVYDKNNHSHLVSKVLKLREFLH